MSINLETALWLDGSLNLETFEDSAFNPAEDKDVMENLKISIGVGTILAVNKDTIIPYLEDPEIRKIRIGVKIMPKNFALATAADFWRIVALCIPLTEY